jgi:hypothetical protein
MNIERKCLAKGQAGDQGGRELIPSLGYMRTAEVGLDLREPAL